MKLSGLRRKWRLQASLMTSTSSCGPLINNVNGKTHPFRRISSKLSDNLVSIVERFASLNWSNISNPLIWFAGFERLFSASSAGFACSQWCCTAVEVGRNTTASTLLRTIEHFGVRSRTDLAFELIPSKDNSTTKFELSLINASRTRWSCNCVVSFVIHISVGGLQELSIRARDASNKCKY